MLFKFSSTDTSEPLLATMCRPRTSVLEEMVPNKALKSSSDIFHHVELPLGVGGVGGSSSLVKWA